MALWPPLTSRHSLLLRISYADVISVHQAKALPPGLRPYWAHKKSGIKLTHLMPLLNVVLHGIVPPIFCSPSANPSSESHPVVCHDRLNWNHIWIGQLILRPLALSSSSWLLFWLPSANLRFGKYLIAKDFLGRFVKLSMDCTSLSWNNCLFWWTYCISYNAVCQY